ncbi:hypothetical protein [Nocardia sp. NPDC005825]|uniref:hypothetical protein n=1 Tax=unclassified Nocardia TaxID=2637762 RepID=UPI0033EB51AF
MRDFMGDHVSQVDKYGHAAGDDGVFMSTSVRGSFRVNYAAHIGKVCVSVEDVLRGGGRMSMQLTLEQAMLLRELVDAGIADALAATTVEPLAELPTGGDPA